MRFAIVPVSVYALFLGIQACSAASPSYSAGEQQAAAESRGNSGGPQTIVSCTDTDDATMAAALTVDSSFHFTWKVGDMTPEGATLTEVSKNVQNDITSYSFRLASGEFIELSMGQNQVSVGFSALYASCAPTTVVHEELIAPAITATAASTAQKQAFATCSFTGDGAEVPKQDTFTVRPSLDGHGAVFEQASDEDSDQSFVLLAHSVTKAVGSQSAIYTGEGGVAVFAAGQHVSSVTELTVTGTSPSASIQWDWQDPLPQSTCQVTGADYAASLLR
jgi:hypothetical protein